MERVAHSIWRLVCTLVVLLPGVVRADDPCRRIVSLAPSVTELLFDLGLGSQVVGRTRFCRYPPEVAGTPEIGGFYDVSVEAIVSLNPSMIVTLEESSDMAQQASRFGAKVVIVDHSSVAGIKKSITEVGKACGVSERAIAKLAELTRREAAIEPTVSTERPRTLVVVGRAGEGRDVSSIYISGSDGFYSDVLKLAGARNIHEKPTTALPLLSSEGLLALNPEVIIEVLNVDDTTQASDARTLWNSMQEIRAVRDGRVYVVTDDFASIPGPRYINLAEKLAYLLRPGEKLTP